MPRDRICDHLIFAGIVFAGDVRASRGNDGRIRWGTPGSVARSIAISCSDLVIFSGLDGINDFFRLVQSQGRYPCFIESAIPRAWLGSIIDVYISALVQYDDRAHNDVIRVTNQRE